MGALTVAWDVTKEERTRGDGWAGAWAGRQVCRRVGQVAGWESQRVEIAKYVVKGG